MQSRGLGPLIYILVALGSAPAATSVAQPFSGVTHITRTETSPRPETMHIVKIDLTAPGIRFKLTAPGGTLETVRQSTLDFLNQEHAQIAVNAHFFLPFPSRNPDADLVGLAASGGNVYSAFEAPVQSYALVPYAPALNIDPLNHAAIVHHDPRFADGKHVKEDVRLWNALAGSAQVITGGMKTIPAYKDAVNLEGLLSPGGPARPDESQPAGAPRRYSNARSWYSLTTARTVVGLARGNQTLILFTVDRAGGSRGMGLDEICDLLVRDYAVHDALNLDGGGSTTLAMQDAVTGAGALVNVSSDGASGRKVGSSLAVFAATAPAPARHATARPPLSQGDLHAQTNSVVRLPLPVGRR